MTDLDIDAIEARAAAATKGPWRVDEMDMYIFGGDGHMVASNCPTEDRWQVRGVGAEKSGRRGAGSQDANAEFIAKAREDVPALVAELRAANKRIDAMEASALETYGRDLHVLAGEVGRQRSGLIDLEGFADDAEKDETYWRRKARDHFAAYNGCADELRASEHDAGKADADWFWLIGYLAGKALTAAGLGNQDKALHHTISTAAALLNWHAALSGESTAMRPGIETPKEEAPNAKP